MYENKQFSVIIIALTLAYVTAISLTPLSANRDTFSSLLARWNRNFQVSDLHAEGWMKLQHTLTAHERSEGQMSEFCDICELGVVFVNINIELGLDYADVREVVIDTCTVSIPFNKSDAMCPGLMDNYYPAVEYILRRAQLDEKEACGKLNFCYYGNPESVNSFLGGGRESSRSFQAIKEKSYFPSSTLRKEIMIKVVQLTDVHIDHEYLTGAATDCGMFLCCREKYDGEGSAGEWGEYPCNTPVRTLELFIRQVSLVDKLPDMVIYTGDTPPHAMWEETQEIQMNYTEYFTDVLKRSLPENVRAYPTIGNHDMFPSNLYFIERQEIKDMNDAYSRWWSDLANFTESQRETASSAGYYSILSSDGRLRIISYNSILPYTQNFYTLLNDETAEYIEMKIWLEETLENARNEGERVILIGHIPLGALTLNSFSEWFQELVVGYSDIIVLQMYGHTHRDHFGLFIDPADHVAKSTYFISPSVTSRYNRNPSARVYWLHPETLSLVDYEQWFLNLTAINDLEGEPAIELMYRASDEYNLPNMTPTSWQDLADRFEADDELFNRYYMNHFTRNGRTDDPNEFDRLYMICEIRNLNYARQQQCIQSGINGTALHRNVYT